MEWWRNQRPNRRALIVAVVLATLVVLGIAGSAAEDEADDRTPVLAQSCAELDVTITSINRVLDGESATEDEREQARRDYRRVVDRLEDLGGCPSIGG